MKFLKYIIIFILSIYITSCTSEEETETLDGEGMLELKFDNSYASSDLLLTTTTYLANDTEKVKVSAVKYIVSNIRFEDSEGTIFEYPTEDSYFIIDEENSDSQIFTLNDIPEGDYTKITFGIGVDQETYLKGAEGQGDLLAEAQELGMMWSWTAGYKFFVFEGTYTSESTTTETAYAFHMGSHGSTLDNYKEVTLTFPNSARVRVEATPSVHIVADISNVLDGETEFMLDDAAQIHVDAVKSPQIATNVNDMFTVHHIHND